MLQSPPVRRALSQGSRCNILRGCGFCEKAWILFSEPIFAFPHELWTSLGVPSNFDDGNTTSPYYCAEENKVTYATGTLTNDALSWWNSYAQPIGIDQANQITWTELKSLLTDKYCPRTEVKKIEDEFYNLVVKGNDLKTYIRRFQELAVLFPNMVPNAEKLMEVFINGLPRSIEGNVTASKPQTLEEAINIAQRLIDQIIKHDSVQEANDRKRNSLRERKHYPQNNPTKQLSE
ncbi:reverse transcriptase domain-containing protein [Tanacetum coccineum]